MPQVYPVYSVHLTLRAHLGDHHFFTGETCWYVGAERVFRGNCQPFPGLAGPLSFAAEIYADPDKSPWQCDFASTDEADPASAALAGLMLDAVPSLTDAPPGLLVENPAPRYKLDNRLSLHK